MKYCQNCGVEIAEDAAFCPSCGAKIEYQNTQKVIPAYKANTNNIKTRSIVTAIILTIITCGIYSIYWMVKLNDELNTIAQKRGISGGMLILLSIVTCGIYSYYWYYKMGENVDEINKNSSNTPILYIILAIFGFSIVNLALMQDAINKAVEE